MDNLLKSMQVSAAGMKVQGTRLRVIAENIANADSLATGPHELPYRRKMVTFESELDRASGLDLVQVKKVGEDPTPFARLHEPGHPAADADGYVLGTNVNSLIEIADMREAQRTYEANLNVIKSSKAMLNQALEILK